MRTSPTRKTHVQLKHFLFLVALSGVTSFTSVANEGWDQPPEVNMEDFRVLFETAKDPRYHHPVNSVKDITGNDLKGGIEEWREWDVMKMSKAEILKLIPQQVGLIHLGCPVENAGPKNAKNDFNDSSQLPRQWGHWRWSPDNPEEYTCSKCGEKFPNNPKYPLDKVDVFHNRLGEKIERRYWLDTAKDKNGMEKRFPKYYLEGLIDYFKMKWTQRQLDNLTEAYVLTGDEAFAYQAAIIMDAMCDVFPHWLYMQGYAHGYKDYTPGLKMKSTYTRTNSRRGEQWTGPINMGRAYDVFFNSEGFAKYSNEIGVDLRAKYLTHIVGMISPDKLSKKGKLPDKGMDGWQQSCPGHGDIKTGRLLHDPRYQRRFIDHMLRLPFIIHGSDGAYFEGTGYTCLQLNPMMKMRDLNGYSDPKSFVPPEGEERVEDWWFPTEHYEEFHRKAYNMNRELCLPDGKGVVFNDSGGGWPSATYLQGTKLPRSFNVMKHGMKHVILGDGVGEDQFQSRILFGLDSKHGHGDTMSMQLYAHGHYMIDDITYPKHRMRSTYGGIQMHNSGVIDGRGHAAGPVGDGKPEIYEPRFTGMAAVRIDGENMYPGYDNTIFERTLVNVTVDPKRPYVVDLFRMNGGRKWREYILLGPYRHKAAEAKMSVPIQKLPGGDRPLMREGAQWKDSGRGDVKYDDFYGIFTNVRAASKNQDFQLTYLLKNTWREKDDGRPQDLYIDPAKPPVGVVNHFIGMKDATPMLADIPRRVDKPGSTMEMEQMPYFLFRDEGMDEESQFICVHEPFKGNPAIRQVRRLPGQGNTLALEIVFNDGRKDLVLISTDEQPLNYDADGVTTNAKMAVLSRPKSGQPEAWMIGGTTLTAQGVSLKQDTSEFKGTIVRSFREWDGDGFNGFEVVAAPGSAGPSLPDIGKDLAGAWITVDNRGVQDKFYDRIINGSIDEWYSKYHKRSKNKYKAEKKKNPTSDYVLDWEADQRRWDNCKKTGAGWAFEIKEVIQKNGRTFIVTRDDHGMKIEQDSQFAQELFFPNRQLKGAETTWKINTAASTLPMKNMTPKEVVITPDQVAALDDQLMSYPQDGNRYHRFIQPENPEDFEAKVVIDVTGSSVAQPPEDAQPGIIHYLGRGGALDGYAGVDEGEMRRYIFKPEGGVQNFKGYLKVPTDGIYTLYYRAGGNGELLVNGQVVSPENRYLGAPYPRIIRLKLKAGYVPIHFWSNMRGTKYWSANNEISWEGPGMERRFMEFSDFVYSQAELDGIAGKVSVNKLGGSDDRDEGIRQHYLAALASGGGEVFLNGVQIGDIRSGGQLWHHSTNLMKGDVLVVKASSGGKDQFAGLSALDKGRPFFGSKDGRVTTTEPSPEFYKSTSYDIGLDSPSDADMKKDRNPLEIFDSEPVWKSNAETIWLKYVIEELPE